MERRRRLVNCPRCGKEFWPWFDGTHARKFCNRRCAFPKKPKAIRVPQERGCQWCGNQFRGRRSQKFCRKQCNDIAKSKRRKAKLRGSTAPETSIAYIYERDRGTCWLCKQKVKRSVRWPLSGAPSIDHVIPLSKGGTDEPSNLRLAHLGCNRTKRAHIETLF